MLNASKDSDLSEKGGGFKPPPGGNMPTSITDVLLATALVGVTVAACQTVDSAATEKEIAKQYFPDYCGVEYRNYFSENAGEYYAVGNKIILYLGRPKTTLLHEAAHQWYFDHWRGSSEMFPNLMETLYLLKHQKEVTTDLGIGERTYDQSDILRLIALAREYKPDYIW